MEKNMKSAKASGTLSLAVLAALASPLAMADDPANSTWDSGWYIGANIGQSRAKIDDAQISSNLLGAGFTTTSISDDDHKTGYKIFGGYQFNQNWALEGGYFNLGTFGFTATTLPPGTLSGNTKITGENFDLVGFLPFTQNFSGFGRIGVIDSNASDNFAGTGLVSTNNPSPSERKFNYKYGFGLQYAFTQSLAMRGEFERYRINDAVNDTGDVDLLSIGLVWRFGGQSSDSKPVAAVEPEPAPPAAQPVLVIVPVVAATQQYCSILDIQFEINQDNIQREEKEKLGVLGTFMTKYPDTTAVIEGHSDNVGKPEDNMKLSQDRAQSVVTNLEDVSHIAASRLSAVGYGDTRPIADNSTEEGKRANRRIDAVIACATDIQGLKVKPARLTMAMQIDYDTNKADVKPEYREELRTLADYLKANPTVTATVEGHTADTQATPQLAMQISQQRAQSVVDYLVDNFGVSKSQLTAQGFGDNRRFAYNTSLEGQRENRRVNIIINYPNQLPNKVTAQ